jgi:hypothetical protein
MGYFFSSRWPTRADMVRHLNADLPEFSKLIKARTVGNNHWQAIEYINAAGENVRYIALALIRHSREAGGYGYKSMDETSGPYYYNCPLNFLEGLSSPIGYAADWREKVRAYHAEKKSRPLFRPGLKMSYNGWIFELIQPAGPRRGWIVTRNDGREFRAGFPVLNKMIPAVTGQDRSDAANNATMSRGRI